MRELLNRLDEVLREIQMDEYLNEETLPKIDEARGLVHKIYKPLTQKRNDKNKD